jgi:hypothetical protein
MGTSGPQRRGGFRRTQAGAGGVPAMGGRGGVLVPQVVRSAVSALRGWSGEPHKSVEIRWDGIGVGLVTATYIKKGNQFWFSGPSSSVSTSFQLVLGLRFLVHFV